MRTLDSWARGHNLLTCVCWIFVALALGCSNEPTGLTPIAGTGSSGSGVTAAGASGNGPVPPPVGGAGRGASGSAGRGASGSNATAGAASRDPVDAGADDAGVVPPNPMDAATSGTPRSTGPGDWMPGDYPPNLMSDSWREISGVAGQGSNVRQYKVHIPPGYKPDVPASLVFCIHGLGQDALLFCVTGSAMNTKSDSANFVLVMPNGYQNSWNAGTCCGGASTEKLDDVALFRAIFKEVGEHVNIDLDRVYATGLSNGGYMSYRLACDAADIFTAVSPGAGAVGTNDIGGGTNAASDFTNCQPSRPVSVLHVHGTSDPLIPYALQAKSLDLMAMKNGCAKTTAPATQPASGGDTTCVTYTGCPAGIELTGCSIMDGGHCWFGSPDCGTGGGDIGLAIVGANSDTMKSTDAAWDFFKRLSR
jgi:polyhydroxybutyrate depolymerase